MKREQPAGYALSLVNKNTNRMKLQNVITFRLSVLKAVSIALWAVCFYFAIIKEINDKTDEALTNYAETLITDYLSG